MSGTIAKSWRFTAKGFYGFSGYLVFHFKRNKVASDHVPGLGIAPSSGWGCSAGVGLRTSSARAELGVGLQRGAGRRPAGGGGRGRAQSSGWCCSAARDGGRPIHPAVAAALAVRGPSAADPRRSSDALRRILRAVPHVVPFACPFSFVRAAD